MEMARKFQTETVPTGDIEFVDGRIEIKDSVEIGQREREFFEKYQNAFSWGIARPECAAHVEGMNNLPPDVASALSVPSGLGGQIEEGEDVVGQWFLQSRRISRSDKMFIMPVMDLVNHGIGVPGYNVKDGVSIGGQFSDEVLVHYCLGYPFGIFLGFGFASPERGCFSLPAMREGSRNLIIQRNFNFKSKRSSFSVPDFKIQDDKVILSCLMIGNMKPPRLSKGIFVSIMKEAGKPNSEEEFDTLLRENRMKFLNLLEFVESMQGELGQTLRTMIRFQFAAMSHCMGMREL
jgi:hypothetical protein